MTQDSSFVDLDASVVPGLPEAAPARRDAMAPAPRDAAAIDAGPSLLDAGRPDPARTSLDVLFVIDNSGSMAAEQEKLARELPRLVGVLVSGNPYFGRERPSDAPSRTFTPVTSLHLAVVSTNVGGLDDVPASAPASWQTCRDGGDDGRFQSSTTVAAEGVVAGASELIDYQEGEVVIAADPSCALPSQPSYQEFAAGQGGDSHAFACSARLGIRGCPFEQPLEAAWKALAPSAVQDTLHSFVYGEGGQGDRANAGFLRQGAALAVIVMTDEDDCSVTAAGRILFDIGTSATEQYGNLNLRCGWHTGDSTLVQPIDRYLQGLRSLKPEHPERVVMGAITGVPEAAIEQGLDHDAILALPEMEFAPDPNDSGYPRAACTRAAGDKLERAFPGRRLVEATREFGAQGVLASICSESYAPAVDHIIQAIAPLITP